MSTGGGRGEGRAARPLPRRHREMREGCPLSLLPCDAPNPPMPPAVLRGSLGGVVARRRKDSKCRLPTRSDPSLTPPPRLPDVAARENLRAAAERAVGGRRDGPCYHHLPSGGCRVPPFPPRGGGVHAESYPVGPPASACMPAGSQRSAWGCLGGSRACDKGPAWSGNGAGERPRRLLLKRRRQPPPPSPISLEAATWLVCPQIQATTMGGIPPPFRGLPRVTGTPPSSRHQSLTLSSVCW